MNSGVAVAISAASPPEYTRIRIAISPETIAESLSFTEPGIESQ